MTPTLKAATYTWDGTSWTAEPEPSTWATATEPLDDNDVIIINGTGAAFGSAEQPNWPGSAITLASVSVTGGAYTALLFTNVTTINSISVNSASLTVPVATTVGAITVNGVGGAASLTLSAATQVGAISITSGGTAAETATLTATLLATVTGNITITGAQASALSAPIESVGNITLSGAAHTFTSTATSVIKLGNINLSNDATAEFNEIDGDVAPKFNVTLASGSEITFTAGTPNIGTLTVPAGATANFPEGAYVDNFAPAVLGVIDGQTITSASDTLLSDLLTATPPLTNVDILKVTGGIVTIDVPFTVYTIEVSAGATISDPESKLKVLKLDLTKMQGAYIGLLSYRDGTDGRGWYYAGTTLGGASGSLITSSVISTSIVVSTDCPASALEGANFTGVGPKIYFAGNGRLNVPSSVATLGEVFAQESGEYLLRANGKLSIGAVRVNNKSNLTLNNSQGSNQAEITIRSGSPSIVVDDATFNIDSTSTVIVDTVVIQNGAVLTYRLGHYLNKATFNKAMCLGGLTTAAPPILPGTFNFIGSGRAAGSPLSPPALTFKENVEMSGIYNGTAFAAGDTAGTFIAITTAMYMESTLNDLATGTHLEGGILDLRGTETHFGDTATFLNMLANNILTDDNTSLIFGAAQTSFPATPTTGRRLFSLIFDSTLAANQLYGNIFIAGDFIANKTGDVINIGNITVGPTTITVMGEVDFGTIAHAFASNTANPLSFIFNGKITNWGASSTWSANVNLTIGGNSSDTVPYLTTDMTPLGDLTINRANAIVVPITTTPATTITNLVVNSGMFKTYNGSTDIPLTVSGNTTIGTGGVLDLCLGATATITHTLGTVGTSTITNNGAILFRGNETPTLCTLTLNGTYINSTGSMTGDVNSVLMLMAKAEFNLPASLSELNELLYDVGTNQVVLGGDLTTNFLRNTSGTLLLAGRTLKVLNSSKTLAPLGYINANNGSTLDIKWVSAGDLTLSFLLKTDETASLILRNGAYIPAVDTIANIKNLTIINDGVITSYTNANALIIHGNLNIVGDTSSAATATSFTGNVFEITLYGDATVTQRGAGEATANLNGSIITTYGQINISSSESVVSNYVSINNTTILNIVGTSKQFQFPATNGDSWSLGKLTLNRPAGARLNNRLSGGSGTPRNRVTFGKAGEFLALEIIQGMLDLNGANITFLTKDHYMSETPNGFVTNTGTSFFHTGLPLTSVPPVYTRGAIYSVEDASEAQIKSIGVDIKEGTYNSTVAGAVRRYPKTVTIPDVGRSVRRYYYVDVVADTLTTMSLSYFKKETVGPEASMKVYLERLDPLTDPTTDAFSNSEQLKANTQVLASNEINPGTVMTSKFEGGSSYEIEAGAFHLSGGYLFTFASLPGGGEMKIWTNNTGDELWQTAGNWGPTTGAPGPLDQVIIARGTGNIGGVSTANVTPSVILNGLGTGGDIFLDGDDITLYGGVPSATNQSVLQVTGNISVEGAASIKGIDGARRLDLNVGDGVIQGVSTQIYGRAADSAGIVGVWFDNVKINMASLSPNDGIKISGNIDLIANSTIQQGIGKQIVLDGLNAGVQKTFTMSRSSAAVFGDIVLMNRANMTTEADFQLKGAFIFTDAFSRWISSAGTIVANDKEQLLWDNKFGAEFVVFNMDIGYRDTTTPTPVTTVSEPIGNITFSGTLNKIGNSTLAPYKTTYTVGAPGEYAVIFDSKTQTEIINGAEGELLFHNLVVKAGTKLKTSSSFNIQNFLYVGDNAEMICEGGTVTYDGKDVMQIVNISDLTLVHYNVNVLGRLTTASSWKLAGDLIVDTNSSVTESYFKQTAGTITSISEGQTKRLIDNMSTGIPQITFNKLLIGDNSILTTGPVTGANPNNTSFAIMNRGANGTMASGIEVAPTGYFNQPAQGTVHFQTDGTVEGDNSKWIINNNVSNKMQFGNVFIEAGFAKNYVKTNSSFELRSNNSTALKGSQAHQFLVAGGGANFEATGGTISFIAPTGTAIISAIAPANAQFSSLRSDSAVTLQINSGDEIWVSGDLIADMTSSFVAGNPPATAIVEMNGKDAPQYLRGTTTETPAFTFTRLRVNKGDGLPFDYVDNPYVDPTGILYMQKTTSIVAGGSSDVSEFILNNGVLNLGVDTLFVAANYITRYNGAIDGAKGTYVIQDGHQDPYLEDPFFMVGNKPTLYNLVMDAPAHQLRNNLTVNGNLTLKTGVLTLAPAGMSDIVEPKLLTLYGDLIQLNTASTLASGSSDNTLNRLVLKGKGTVQGGLRNELFEYSAGPPPVYDVFSITVQRGESLGGLLTMKSANLTIQTGVNTLALNGNTLILSDDNSTTNPSGITIISGSITADPASTVDFRNIDVIPANMFAKSEAGTIILGDLITPHEPEIQLRGNVTINTKLEIRHPSSTDNMKIITGGNILTIGPSATTDLNSTHYVVGNLQKTVTNVAKVIFEVGTEEYTPVYMRYATMGSSQQVLVNSKQIDPTAGRGGNPDNSINVVWNIQPQGEPVRDSLLLEFGFQTFELLGDAAAGTTPPQNVRTFAAKWDNGDWTDYRNTIATLTSEVGVSNKLNGILNRYVIRNSEALEGDWAIFVSNLNTDQSKYDAIRTDNNRLVIKELPTPVETGRSFRMVIGLEDRYGQPAVSSVELPIEILFANGGLEFVPDPVLATFPVNRSEMNIQLQVKENSSPVAQIEVRVTGDSAVRWTPAISDYFAVIPAAPAVQASNIQFTRITYTSAKATWENGDGERVLIVAKAKSLLEANEYPLNGVTYIPNQVYGAGSNIGNAVVLYDGPGTGDGSMEIYGLLPNTDYYVYAFAYSGAKGAESYKITAATRNPNMLSTLKGIDDDNTLGENNEYVTSVTVGTNASVVGMIYPSADVDCFNFMVTSAAPNVRVLLVGNQGGDVKQSLLPENLTLELYDFTGRRIRRSTLNARASEALVVNDLPAGTYVVKVFAEDPNFASDREADTYRLLINTFSNEIFSVTPVSSME